MKFCIVIAAFLCVGASFADNIEEDEGVLVVTKQNFKQVLEENTHVLFEFYAPWCGHCKALAPEYAKAAKLLAEQKLDVKVKLAKVDAIQEPELAEEHSVRGYPTLKFYRNGDVTDYTGGRTADDIVAWINKKTGPAAATLKNEEETKDFIESQNVAIVGFFKDADSAEAKVFLDVANAIDDHVFGITGDQKVMDEYSAADGKIILFKKFDEGQALFEGELTVENLKKFVAMEALPLIVDFNHETAQKIFGGEIKSHLLVFLSKEAGHFDKYVEEMKEPAKKFRGEVLCVTINADENDHERILEFFGMKKEDVPAMRLIKLEQDMAKYKPENAALEKDNINDFITKFTEGKLSRHLLTQDLPENWDKAPVKVLVGTNFAEVAFDKKKDVLVEFYAPWCGHCQQLVPIYDALGEKFKDDDTVVIAKMDATANELDEVKINSFPTITLYKKETNEAVEYNGERTLEGLTKFIETNGVYGQAAEEAQEEVEDDDVPRRDEL